MTTWNDKHAVSCVGQLRPHRLVAFCLWKTTLRNHKNSLPLATGSFGRWERFASEGARAHHMGMAWIFVPKVWLIYCFCCSALSEETKEANNNNSNNNIIIIITTNNNKQQQTTTNNNKQQATSNSQQPTTNSNSNSNSNTHHHHQQQHHQHQHQHQHQHNHHHHQHQHQHTGWSFAANWVTNLVQTFGCSESSIPISHHLERLSWFIQLSLMLAWRSSVGYKSHWYLHFPTIIAGHYPIFLYFHKHHSDQTW